MRPRWIILGLFLAGIVYGTIIWWPVRPMWTVNLSRFSEILAFSGDSNSLFMLNDKRKENQAPVIPHFSRWDARTGKLLSETPINIPEPLERVEYKINSDGTALIVSGNTHRERRADPYVFYVIDTASGQKRLGPIECADYSRDNIIFSKNGRWIAYSFRNENNSAPANEGGVEIIESNTGNRIFHVARPEHEAIKNICFSNEGTAIAFLQRKDGIFEDSFSIRIFDLPGGKERKSFPLRKRKWRLNTFEGQHLTASAPEPDPSKRDRIFKFFSFDLESVPIGQESERPELEIRALVKPAGTAGPAETNWFECKQGDGWRVKIKYGDPEPDWLWKYWNKCAEWLGAKKAEDIDWQFRLRFLDVDTNRVRYQSPHVVNSKFCIATNGASYADMNFHTGELSVWNAQPFPRWPWAMAASLGTLLLILLLGRWRSKRLSNSRS